MSSRLSLVIGGPVYRSYVHVIHSMAVAVLSAMCSQEGSPFVLSGFDYMHTSDLPRGRCQWLRRCIDDNRYDIAISLDADTAIVPADLLPEISSWMREDTAIGICPVRVGGTQLVNINLFSDDGREVRATADDIKMFLGVCNRISSGGFGCAVFNLHWFRTTWKQPFPEHASMDFGEDIAMCRSVRDRGGVVRALRVRTQHQEFAG